MTGRDDDAIPVDKFIEQNNHPRRKRFGDDQYARPEDHNDTTEWRRKAPWPSMKEMQANRLRRARKKRGRIPPSVEGH